MSAFDIVQDMDGSAPVLVTIAVKEGGKDANGE